MRRELFLCSKWIMTMRMGRVRENPASTRARGGGGSCNFWRPDENRRCTLYKYDFAHVRFPSYVVPDRRRRFSGRPRTLSARRVHRKSNGTGRILLRHKTRLDYSNNTIIIIVVLYCAYATIGGNKIRERKNASAELRIHRTI